MNTIEATSYTILICSDVVPLVGRVLEEASIVRDDTLDYRGPLDAGRAETRLTFWSAEY